MLRHIARLSIILATWWLAACDNNPHPAPLQKTRPDGSPWVVRYQAIRADPRSFDPQYTYDQISRKVIESVYDTLLEYHPMKTDPYELQPCMLAEMPVKSPDGLSYECRIRPGIHFHDDPCFPGGKGRELVAEDIQFVFQRLTDPAVESPFESIFEDCLLGMKETHDAASQNPNRKLDYDKQRVPAVEVLDRYRFRLKLTKQYPQILYWLAFQCTAPVAREAVEYYNGKNGREDFHKFACVGTGPFKIEKYVPRSRVTLQRVPNYTTSVFPSDGFPADKAEFLGKLAGKPLPFLDEIQLTVQAENIPRFVQFRQGYLDVMGVDKDSFVAMVSPMKTLSEEFAKKGTILEPAFEISTFWTSYNMEDPVVGKNLKLRQALACAADSKRYCEIFYAGVAPVATQLLPLGIFGHDRNHPARYPFDLERAKQLLAEAGYPGGRDASGQQLELTMTAQSEGSEQRQRAEFEQRCFEKLGIKVKVVEVTFAHLQDIEDRGNFQILSGGGWGADYPDPENYFMLLYSKNVPPAGKNYFRFRDPDYDRIFEKMVVTENGPERMEMIRQLNQIIEEKCPIFPTFHKAQYLSVQPWAPLTQHNLMYEVDGGHKYLVTDPAMRERLQQEWNRPAVWPAVLLGLISVGGVLAFIRAVRRTRQQTA